MPRPHCNICKEDYNRSTIRPHIISECGHTMCLECCKRSGKCGTCNGSYKKNGSFNISHDLESNYEELMALTKEEPEREQHRSVNAEDIGSLMQRLLRPDSATGIEQSLMERLFRPVVSPGAAENTFKISVRGYAAGKTYKIEVKLADTVLELKQKIWEYTGVKPFQQRLLAMGKMIEDKDDQKTLADCGITKESTIDLASRLKGGNRSY